MFLKLNLILTSSYKIFSLLSAIRKWMVLSPLKEFEQHKILIRNPFPFGKNKNKDIEP